MVPIRPENHQQPHINQNEGWVFKGYPTLKKIIQLTVIVFGVCSIVKFSIPNNGIDIISMLYGTLCGTTYMYIITEQQPILDKIFIAACSWIAFGIAITWKESRSN